MCKEIQIIIWISLVMCFATNLTIFCWFEYSNKNGTQRDFWAVCWLNWSPWVKGQKISKHFFSCLHFFQKIIDKTNFVRFLEELKSRKNDFEIFWPLKFFLHRRLFIFERIAWAYFFIIAMVYASYQLKLAVICKIY